MFCCVLLYVHPSIAIILMGKRELVNLLNVSPWCLLMVELLFHAVPWGCLQFVIMVIPDHTHLLFFIFISNVIFVLNSNKNNSLYEIELISSNKEGGYVKLSKHIRF